MFIVMHSKLASFDWALPVNPDGAKMGNVYQVVRPCPIFQWKSSLQVRGVSYPIGPDVYLDNLEPLQLNVTVEPEMKLFVLNSNPALHAFRASATTALAGGGDLTTSTRAFYSLDDRATNGSSSVLVTPEFTSLRCERPVVVQRIVSECPPTLKLEEDRPLFNLDNIVADRYEGTEKSGFSIGGLPVNYRPPSEFGRGVPITDNIYNADPSKERWFDFFPRSKETGKFKACAGKATREECRCREREIISQRVEDSDCIDAVRRQIYGDPFVPMLKLTDRAGDKNSRLSDDIVFKVREINGRTDFCSNSTDSCKSIDKLTFSARERDAIVFRGDGLFHFEYSIINNLTKCNLTLQQTLFVDAANLTTQKYYIIISGTSIGISLVLLFGYIFYFRKVGRLGNA